MRFNLKNFPKCEDTDSIANLVVWQIELKEWFEGFEAELREIYEWWKKHTELDKQSGYVVTKDRTVLISTLEEILANELG